MKAVMWVLAGIGGLLLLGGVILPLVGWVISTLMWLAVGALVIGAGIAVARGLGAGRERGQIGR